MKFISNCIEFNPYGISSIKYDISNEEMANKNIILDYLKNGEDAGVRCSVIMDRVKNEQVHKTIHRFKDDEYIWTSEDIYHFEKYNMRLNDEFINKVLAKYLR